MADIPDPTIRLTIPGTGTLSLCVPPTGQATCTDNFTQDNGVNLIGTNGFASFALKNVNTVAAIDMDFFFHTDNLLSQDFSATTTDFTTVVMHKVFDCIGCLGGTLEVDYSGIQDGGSPGSAFIAATPCGHLCSGIDGFTPGSNIKIVTTYGNVSDFGHCCDGLQPFGTTGEEAGVSITRASLPANVPEPGSLVLLVGAAALLAVKRRLWRS